MTDMKDLERLAWQPIETAPVDGTRVLIYSPVEGVGSSHFQHGVWQGLPWRAPGNPDFWRAKPTRWMPTPEPPGDESALPTLLELVRVQHEALEGLWSAAEDSDGCQYGTLDTDFVRSTARAALAKYNEMMGE